MGLRIVQQLVKRISGRRNRLQLRARNAHPQAFFAAIDDEMGLPRRQCLLQQVVIVGRDVELGGINRGQRSMEIARRAVDGKGLAQHKIYRLSRAGDLLRPRGDLGEIEDARQVGAHDRRQRDLGLVVRYVGGQLFDSDQQIRNRFFMRVVGGIAGGLGQRLGEFAAERHERFAGLPHLSVRPVNRGRRGAEEWNDVSAGQSIGDKLIGRLNRHREILAANSPAAPAPSSFVNQAIRPRAFEKLHSILKVYHEKLKPDRQTNSLWQFGRASLRSRISGRRRALATAMFRGRLSRM